jgi:hypothetical protein
MARPCFCLFADRLALSSGVWTTCSSTPTLSPHPIYSPRTPLLPVRKLVVRRVLISRIIQRSSCCDMNMLCPCPALMCPSSVDELRKYSSMKTRSDGFMSECLDWKRS